MNAVCGDSKSSAVTTTAVDPVRARVTARRVWHAPPPRGSDLMHVRDGRRLFPYYTAVGVFGGGGDWPVTAVVVTATASGSGVVSAAVVVTGSVVVERVWRAVVITAKVMRTAPPGLVAASRRQLPALERSAATGTGTDTAVARGLAVVQASVVIMATATARAADTATVSVTRVPAAYGGAPREEQLEEQSLELLAEYHVNDEVHRRVDGDQQVADFDQLVHCDAVERLGHVRN